MCTHRLSIVAVYVLNFVEIATLFKCTHRQLIVVVYMYNLGIHVSIPQLFKVGARSSCLYIFQRVCVYVICHDCDCFGVAPVVICSLVVLSVLCLDCPILGEDVLESLCRVDSTHKGGFFGDDP